jgi:hypothetical protein
MCSKITLVLAFVFSFLGCAKGPPANTQTGQVVRLKVGGVDCLNGIGKRFSDYVAGVAQPGELHVGWVCVEQIVTDFSNLTTDKATGYSKENLREFIERYYLKSGFPANVMDVTMGLKQILVGGTTDEITRIEIANLQRKFQELDDTMEALRPLTPILFADGNKTVSDTDWDQAYAQFVKTIAKIGTDLPGDTQPYNLDQATLFLNTWADYLKVSNTNLLRTIAKDMPIIAAAKVILVGGTPDVMAPLEWPKLFSALADAYTGLRLAERIYGQSPLDISQVIASSRFEPLVEKVFGFIESGVRAHSSASIPFSEIDLLLERIEQAGALPTNITAKSLEGFVRFLFGKLFASPDADPNAIDLARVTEMKTLTAQWRTNQAALETGDYSQAQDLMAATHPGWSLTFDSKGRLEIPPSQSPAPREFSVLFTLLKWTGEKWGAWPLTEDAFHSLVSDFVNQLHAFNLLSNTTDAIYKRLLREANLFLPSSTGDTLLDPSEAFQYAMFITSAYRGSHLLATETKSCGDDGACAQQVLFQNRSEILSNFPKLLTWLGNDQKRFQDFDQKLVTIAGDGNWVVHFVVFHYIENFLQRFDANSDGIIDLKEATTSFKIYGSVLGDLLTGVGFDPKDTWPTYTFMFKYGATPVSIFGGSVRYLYWKWYPESWVLTADRSTLAGILSELTKL